jgi:O-methyltransferase
MALSDVVDNAKRRTLNVAYKHLRRDIDADAGYRDRETLCKPYTMTSPERLYALYEATRYVLDAGIAGDFVECGVWRGGSSLMMALELHARGAAEEGRNLYLFDTFAGMSEPDANDGVAAQRKWRQRQRTHHNEWCFASEDEVRRNVATSGIAEDRIRTVVGKVEETIPAEAPDSIAILRLDTDWYESTRHELEHLYPRLSPGGVLIIDDYGHWEGARKAVDEYFEGQPVLLQRIDYTARMLIKSG